MRIRPLTTPDVKLAVPLMAEPGYPASAEQRAGAHACCAARGYHEERARFVEVPEN